MKKRNILIIILFFAFALTLFGQDFSSGRIYSAQGNDFVILSKGKRILYSADRLNEGTITLERGDIFQTGPQSTAEIQFGNNGPFVKIVENSSIGFNDSKTSQSVLTLNLLYGRVRVKNPVQEPVVNINSNNGLVEIKKGDAGIDYIIRNDTMTRQSGGGASSPVLYVSNLSGETTVYPSNNGAAASNLPQLLVHEGETVSVEFVSSLSYVERKPLENSTISFWKIYDFSAVPGSSAGVAAGAPSIDVPLPSNIKEIPNTPLSAEGPSAKSISKTKNRVIVAGLLFCLGGLALEGASLYYQSVGDETMTYFYGMSGAFTSGIGVLTLFGALGNNPK